MSYALIAICYFLVTFAEWPCKKRLSWRRKLYHSRHLISLLIAVTYLGMCTNHNVTFPTIIDFIGITWTELVT